MDNRSAMSVCTRVIRNRARPAERLVPSLYDPKGNRYVSSAMIARVGRVMHAASCVPCTARVRELTSVAIATATATNRFRRKRCATARPAGATVPAAASNVLASIIRQTRSAFRAPADRSADAPIATNSARYKRILRSDHSALAVTIVSASSFPVTSVALLCRLANAQTAHRSSIFIATANAQRAS